MTHTPSGQQAVEPVLSAAETADRLEAWAREMLASTPPKTGALHLLDAVHYLRTAAPTAPSTALTEAHVRAADEAWLKAEGGIRGAIRATFAAGYEAAVNERAAAPSTAAGERERLEEERNRLSNHFGYGARLDGSTRERIAAIDARLAALATPSAQGVEEETETLENLIDAAIGARTTPPWQEQAAQIRRDALEEAAKVAEEVVQRGEWHAYRWNDGTSIASAIRALIPNERKDITNDQ